MNEGENFKFTILNRLKTIEEHRENARINYQNLSTFIININICIQELRNLTFLIQKNNSSYGDEVLSWYQGKQEIMKEQKHLRRIVDSRNKIVKVSDLQLKSEGLMMLFNRNEFHLDPIEIDPFITNYELLNHFKKICEQKNIQIFSNATRMPVLKIKKIWRDADYEQQEVLYLIKYGFDFLSSLIEEYLNLINLPISININLSIIELERSQTYYLDVASNEIISVVSHELNFDEELFQKVESQFGEKIREIPTNETQDPIYNVLNSYISLGKILISSGQEHHPMCIFLSDTYVSLDMKMGALSDRVAKYVWINTLAAEVKRNNSIHAVLLINEAWNYKMEDIDVQTFGSPEFDANIASNTQRSESLLALFLNINGVMAEMSLPIFRKEKNVKFGQLDYIIEQENLKGSESAILDPFRRAWNLI